MTTNFRYSPEFAEDIKAFHGIEIADIEAWIVECENPGKLTANHQEVGLTIHSHTSWPCPNRLIFEICLVSNTGDVIDTKFL